MKQSRFTQARIIRNLKEQESGSPTSEVCRKHGISSATFYKYKARFGGLNVLEAQRLKALLAFTGGWTTVQDRAAQVRAIAHWPVEANRLRCLDQDRCRLRAVRSARR